jgi:hypothetical protein
MHEVCALNFKFFPYNIVLGLCTSVWDIYYASKKRTGVCDKKAFK